MSKPKILPKIDALNIIDFRLKKEDLIDILVDDKRKDNDELLKILTNQLNDLSIRIINIYEKESESFKLEVLNLLINNNLISKEILELIKKEVLSIQYIPRFCGGVNTLKVRIIGMSNSSYKFNPLYRQINLEYLFSFEEIVSLKKYKKINEYFDLKINQSNINNNITKISNFNYQEYKKEMSIKLTKQILSNINNGEDIFKLINNKNNELSESKKEETKTEIKSTNRRVRKTTSK